MRPINRTLSSALILFAAVALTTSCKKQLEPMAEPGQNSATLTSTPMGGSCNPVVFGATVGYPGVPNKWVTLMQKWYGDNGKPAFLKAHFYTEYNDFATLEHSIEWGELSYYNNNQVYLKSDGDTAMRVTIDAQQRPAASYYHHNHFPHGSYLVDTSYYHYNGDKLQAIERLHVNSYGGPSQFTKYEFFYDGFGNLVRIDRWNPAFNTSSMFFSYDYAKPVHKMMSPHQVTIPYKLLEYMDLLKFPIHHQLTHVTGFGNLWSFVNFTMTGHMVTSYEATGGNQRTFYTGWSCPGMPATETLSRQNTNIKNLDDFRRLFPEQK